MGEAAGSALTIFEACVQRAVTAEPSDEVARGIIDSGEVSADQNFAIAQRHHGGDGGSAADPGQPNAKGRVPCAITVEPCDAVGRRSVVDDCENAADEHLAIVLHSHGVDGVFRSIRGGAEGGVQRAIAVESRDASAGRAVDAADASADEHRAIVLMMCVSHSRGIRCS